MKCAVSEILIIFLLCFFELFKIASSNRRHKPMAIIDNFLGLAELNQNEIEKRNSIVDGGVFVPYKSTTIVYKSRLVPVTYGFVIKKETLKDNPALYKLGVKLLDEKVEPTPKEMPDEKTVETAQKPLLDAKSNCVSGSKVLRLLAKLSKDINKIEKSILKQSRTHQSAEQGKVIAKSLKKKEVKKLHPQDEQHVSGQKGMFEKELNKNKKSSKHYISKNLSRYWQCRKSHSRKKCHVLLLAKHSGRTHHRSKQPKRHRLHDNKHHRKHPSRVKKHERRPRPFRQKLDERPHLGKHKKSNDSAKHHVKLRKRKKFRKKVCKHCKVKHRHHFSKHRKSSRKHKS